MFHTIKHIPLCLSFLKMTVMPLILKHMLSIETKMLGANGDGPYDSEICGQGLRNRGAGRS